MEDKIAKLQNQEEDIKTKFFTLGLKMIFVFAAPAFIALFGGQYLDKHFNTGKTITLSLLAIAFISSWVIIWYMQRLLTIELRKKRGEIKELEKSHQGVDTEM